MNNVFMFEQHFLTKAIAKAGIQFPVTKQEAIAKAGDLEVKVDFDKYVPLKDMIAELPFDYFPISAVFVNAYMANKLKKIQ